jgi:hypothetical protein
MPRNLKTFYFHEFVFWVDNDTMEEGKDGGEAKDTEPRAYVAGLKIEIRWEGTNR